MTEYRVFIELDVEADSPEAAALQTASAIQDGPVFHTYKRDELAPGGIETDTLIIVDLADDGEVWEVHPNGAMEVLDQQRYEAPYLAAIRANPDNSWLHRPDVAECGGCGRMWDDAVVTGVTPTPSARCPFEYDHDEEDDA